MKKHILFSVSMVVIFLFSISFAKAQRIKTKKADTQIDTIIYVANSAYGILEIKFSKGESYNHPTFAIWLEDDAGNYLETVFITEYFATGIFGNADAGNGVWSGEKGESIRPAALPYWSHKRNIPSRDSLFVPTPENPVTDAITGSTPGGNFILQTSLKKPITGKFRVLLEINQTWDWNDYWTNSLYPDDKDYNSSSQPSVVYEVIVDPAKPESTFIMKPIGHGHYSGKDGSLTTDLSTLTTALEIANKIEVTFLTR